MPMPSTGINANPQQYFNTSPAPYYQPPTYTTLPYQPPVSTQATFLRRYHG